MLDKPIHLILELCLLNQIPHCPSPGEEIGFSEIISIFAVIPLVGDVLNLGHSAFYQADAALDQEQLCQVLPKVSEFCPSHFQ